MPIVEIDRTYTLTSTGNTTRIDGGMSREWCVVAETPSASSCTFILQTARDETSTTVAIPYGVSQNLNASSGVALQFSGPAVLFARVTDLSGSVTFRFRAN